jgi:hypothetical protein
MSDEHMYLLMFCAKKANACIKTLTGRTMSPQELINEGWWRCVRRVEADDLKKTISNVISEMVRYGISENKTTVSLGGRENECLEPLQVSTDAGNGTDARYIVDELRRRIRPQLFYIGWATLAEGRSAKELATELGVSSTYVNNLRNAFLERAAAVLVGNEVTAYIRRVMKK